MKDDLFSWKPCAIRSDKVWKSSRTKGETDPAYNGRGSDESALLRQQKTQTTTRIDRDLFERQVQVSQHLPGIFTNAVPSVLLWAQPQPLKNLKILTLGLKHVGLPQIQARQGVRKSWAQSASWALAKGC